MRQTAYNETRVSGRTTVPASLRQWIAATIAITIRIATIAAWPNSWRDFSSVWRSESSRFSGLAAAFAGRTALVRAMLNEDKTAMPETPI